MCATKLVIILKLPKKMKGIFEKTWKTMKIAAVFVWRNRRKRMSLRDRRGTEGDGGGRMEGGQREDVPRL